MNNIKSAVNDNNARLSVVESASGISTDFSGYGTPFSADGAPKNVVVLRRLDSDGSGSYHVRSRYANSIEQVSVEGVMKTRPFIANYAYIAFDSNGDLTNANNWIEAPLTANYLDYVVEESTYDVSNAAKTVVGDTRRDVWVGSSTGPIQTGNVTVYTSGIATSLEQYHDVRTKLGSGNIDSLAFADLMGFHRHYNTTNSYRVRAKGIGDVMHMFNGSTVRKIIYYQVDGVTGGSLAGTPFDSGEVFHGVFF